MTYDTINDAVTIPGNGEGTLLANRYRIVRQLGAGGMGSVWLAEDTQLDNKEFAIKMLPAILVANKRAYRQLKDEALVAMKLTHPNIVTLRAFEENNGNPFLVMDYVDGQTLDDYLADKGRLSEDEVIKVLRPIAAALDYAHGEGVVHRDVKPANVMIRKDGHPFILDFGIAREIQETMTRVTGKLSSGTLLYMSQEQLMGESPKPAQDVYSFAAMVYECLKGEPPFVRGAIEDQIKNKAPEPLPGGTRFVASVLAGLAKNPKGRPATCAAVLEGDDLTQRREDTEAQNGGAGAPRDRSGNGGALKAFTVASIIALAVVGGWWYSNQKQEEARMAERRAEEARKAEEVQRKAKEAEEQKIKAERMAAAEKKARQAAEAAARNAAAEIRVEAKVQKANIELISDADGFKDKKNALAELFARADALFDEKTRQWNVAAGLFTNYVSRSKELIKLDGERQTAMQSRRGAQEAFRQAENAGAKKYATENWNLAVKAWNLAAEEFKRMNFPASASAFAKTQEQFLDVGRNAVAMKAKREQDALEVLSRDPWKYDSVADDLDDNQKPLLAELYARLVTAKLELEALLSKFTNAHPDVRESRLKLADVLADFHFQINLFRGKASSVQNVKIARERYEGIKKVLAESTIGTARQNAFNDLKFLAGAGYAPAQFEYAKRVMEADRRGVTQKEYAEAVAYMKSSADAGYGPAVEMRSVSNTNEVKKNTTSTASGLGIKEEKVRSNHEIAEKDAVKDDAYLFEQIRTVIQTASLMDDKPLSKILFQPSNPSFTSKWQNFYDEIKDWGQEHKQADAFALVDITLFGAGDEGVLIDKSGITVRQMSYDGNGNGFISWEAFGDRGVVKWTWWGGELMLCNSPKICLHGLTDSKLVVWLFSRLLDVAREVKMADGTVRVQRH